jgi:signal peptidase II
MIHYRKKQRIHIILQILLMILLIAADQWTKHLAVRFFSQQPDQSLIGDAVVLHYLENTGAAFGIFRNAQWVFFIVAGVVLIAVVCIYIHLNIRLHHYCTLDASLFKEKTYKDRIFLNYLFAVLAAGAIGNLIDRILHNYVIDFIYVKLINFPVFNLADIFVTCSVIILIIYFIFVYKEDENFKR